MPTSVLDIDVNDAKFAAFQASFTKYHDMLGKLPGKWKEAGKATEENVTVLGRMTAALLAQQELLSKTHTVQEKLGRETDHVDRAMQSLVRDSAQFAKNIAGATLSLLKWTGVFTLAGGLLGAGGLWGIEHLAMAGAGQRRSALGLGISTAEQQAFALNYGRLVDPHATLSNVAEAKSDYSRRWAFSAMGIEDVENKNAAQLSAEAIARARKIMSEGELTQQRAQATGLLEIFGSLENLRRIRDTPDAQFRIAETGYKRDVGGLAVSPEILDRWQNFSNQLLRAGQTIENILITKLVGLATPLERLSESVVNSIATLTSNPRLAEWIEGFGKGIERVAKYIGSESFQSDLKSGADAVAAFGKAVASVVTWINGIFGPKVSLPANLWEGYKGGPALTAPGVGWGNGPEMIFDPVTGTRGVGGTAPDYYLDEKAKTFLKKLMEHWGIGGGGAGTGAPLNNPGNLRSWFGAPQVGGFAQFPDMNTGLRAMADQLRLYYNRDKLDTLTGIITKYAPPQENDTAAYIKDVASRTGFGANDRLDLNNDTVLARVEAAMAKHENVKNNFTPAQVFITISNNTGGSAVVTSSQLAQ